MDRVWQWWRQHELSNGIVEDATVIIRITRKGWNKLTRDRFHSITATASLTHEIQAGLVSNVVPLASAHPDDMAKRVTDIQAASRAVAPRTRVGTINLVAPPALVQR